jgi:hypothetical protein
MIMALSGIPTTILPLVCVTIAALTCPAVASPTVAKKKQAETFSGNCEMTGVIRHDPPMTLTPKTTSVHGSFKGTCSGELTDKKGRTRRIEDAPGSYDGRGVGALSCLGGVVTGAGKLRFGRGRTIDFTLTERRGPGTAVVTIKGKAGGTGTVFGTVSRDEDLADINERCMGSGLERLRGDARIVSRRISG